ncbi:MAG: sulfatase-like hydrolase/transferase [Akkermansiaceae bacterium]|nr:sulfatase-like hydrolase/transferase [Akkermansiaceae bacterium]MCP5549930.1 sulfatase-like hydrolase/transferase [Akkermansiaceae bacterium]
MTDDQGYWDTGATGNPHIDTPHMDRIAAEGTQFRRYYAAPVCSPTRAGVMSGRYYLRTGLYNTRFGGDTMGLGETTVAQLLKMAGYRTGLFGKWHLGKYPGYQPRDRGFDEFFGSYHGHIERYEFPDQVYHNGKPVEARGYVSELFADAAMDFMEATERAGDAPFFCALMFNAPHSPWLLDTSHAHQPEGDELLGKYLGRGLPMREARIYALIERVDRNIGRVLAKLDELGVAGDTLVVFTSDNGGVSKYWKGDMNGNKASVYEGGVRAPCFVRWPGTVPAGGVVDAQVSHVDWLPTFCGLAGVRLPDDLVLDGKSLVPLLKAGRGDTHHEFVYHTWDRYSPNPDRRWSISGQQWKLLGQFGETGAPSPSGWKLFDLENDPGETKNLAPKHPETVEELRGEFERWFAEVTDGVVYEPIAIPVGDPREESVELEPSWAKWSGKNTRYTFDGYDWDTLDGWREPGEKAEWKIDVVQPGRYAVTLSYGCRPVDAGGGLRLSAGNGGAVEHTIRATATAEQFETFEAGEIELPKGKTTLTAEVLSAPGAELARLNAVRLRRIAP